MLSESFRGLMPQLRLRAENGDMQSQYLRRNTISRKKVVASMKAFT